MFEYHLAFEKRTLPEMRNTQENRTQWRVESTSKTLADGCPWSIFCDSEHLSAKHPSVAPSIPTWSKLWWSNDVMSQLLVKKSQEHQTFQFSMGDDGDLGTCLEALWGTWPHLAGATHDLGPPAACCWPKRRPQWGQATRSLTQRAARLLRTVLD